MNEVRTYTAMFVQEWASQQTSLANLPLLSRCICIRTAWLRISDEVYCENIPYHF